MPWALQQQFQNPAAVNSIQSIFTYFEENYCINSNISTCRKLANTGTHDLDEKHPNYQLEAAMG